MNDLPSIAIIGAGGFAREHHRAARALEDQGVLRVSAACDPVPEVLAAASRDFAFDSRGIEQFPDYHALLDFAQAQPAAFITIPTPVPLHAAMHAAAIERGLSVYLEKPPTLDPEELARMIQCAAAAPHTTTVGFNFIVQPERQALKQRLLDGEFGRIEHVSFFGLWPRTSGYFARAGWAGRLMVNDQLTLDSGLTNAMAHYVHDSLFWAGTESLFSWATPTRARSALWRGHDIESFDTAFVAAELSTGIPLRIALTHAAVGPHRDCELVHCAKADILFYQGEKRFEVRWHDGRVEDIAAPADPLELNLRHHLGYVLGHQTRPTTRLADARPFVQLCGLSVLAAGGITTRTDEARHSADGSCMLPNIDEQVHDFVDTGQWPPGSDAAARAPVDISRLKDLRATVVQYAQARAAEGWKPRKK